MALARAASASGGGAIGSGLVVHLLVALPAAELVLPLDDGAGHGVVDGLTEISVRGAEATGVGLVRMTLTSTTDQHGHHCVIRIQHRLGPGRSSLA